MNMEKLMELAREARGQAYCPYSEFAVGAALLAKSGGVYVGCNVENASFSLGCCAERTAIFKAITAGEREFQAIAICGGRMGEPADSPCIPCGACLQVMTEFCEPEFQIILTDGVHTLEDFLPKRFVL